MFKLSHTLIDGLILSALASAVLIVTLLFNPRLYLQDYPESDTGAGRAQNTA